MLELSSRAMSRVTQDGLSAPRPFMSPTVLPQTMLLLTPSLCCTCLCS
jgi:hypothetical protein